MTPANIKRIHIVDDHPVFVEGLTTVLARAGGWTLAGVSNNWRTALQVVRADPVDLVIVELAVDGISGLDLVQMLNSRTLRVPVLCISALNEDEFAERALRAGARGFVPKTGSPEEIVTAVRNVMDGQLHLRPETSRRILGRLVGVSGEAGEPSGARLEQLSNRELQVIHQLGMNRNSEEIARSLRVGVKTVELHRARIREKLQFQSVADLVRFSARWIERDLLS